MKIYLIYLIISANFIATIVAYYKKCYDEFSLCMITNTANGSKFRLTRSSAVDWCKEHSSTLAIITNETVQSTIEEFINDSSAKLEWVVITNGFRYTENTWKWINGKHSDIYPNSNVDYRYFRYAFLDVSAYYGTSVSFYGQATSKRKFICSFLNHNSSCPGGHQQLGRSCYKMHDKEVTWFDARSICLKTERSDLATFENGSLSLALERRRNDEYWIGLRIERWAWWNGQTSEDIKYSNWKDGSPGSTERNCLCLLVTDGKWITCNCTWDYRYVCIQDYASGSASTATTSATKMTTTANKSTTITKQMITKTTRKSSKMTTTARKPTTTTTKPTTTTTTKTTTTTAKLKTNQSTTTTVPTVGDSFSQFHSTPTHTLDDNTRSKVSENPTVIHDSEQSSDSQRLIIWIPLAVSIILIAVFVSRMVIKKLRKRKRQGESSTTNTCQPASSADTYATLKPAEASIEDRTYAELTLYETIEDEKQKNFKFSPMQLFAIRCSLRSLPPHYIG